MIEEIFMDTIPRGPEMQPASTENSTEEKKEDKLPPYQIRVYMHPTDHKIVK